MSVLKSKRRLSPEKRRFVLFNFFRILIGHPVEKWTAWKQRQAKKRKARQRRNRKK